MYKCLYLQVDTYAVYTDMRMYVHTNSSVRTCVREIMQVCVRHGLFVC